MKYKNEELYNVNTPTLIFIVSKVHFFLTSSNQIIDWQIRSEISKFTKFKVDGIVTSRHGLENKHKTKCWQVIPLYPFVNMSAIFFILIF